VNESSTKQSQPYDQRLTSSHETLLKAEQLNLNFHTVNNDLTEVCSWNNSQAIDEKIDLAKVTKMQEKTIFDNSKMQSK
jgi:hypothetical protein